MHADLLKKGPLFITEFIVKNHFKPICMTGLMHESEGQYFLCVFSEGFT